MTNEWAIETRGITRVFESRKGFLFREVTRTEALRGVDLSVEPGAIFGLLGPNGAGKTTFVKILSTLLLPTSGQAFVLGHDVARDATWLRPRIGLVLGGERGLYNRINGRDNLRYFADLYGIPIREREELISRVLERVDLTWAASRRVEEYSRGMKQKLHLARGILHRPEVLFLDEPGFEDDEVDARRRLPGGSKVVSEEFGPRTRLTMRLRTLQTTSDDVQTALPGHAELQVRERRTSLEDVYLDLVEEEAT